MPHLFNDENLDEYASSITAGLALVRDRVSGVRSPCTGATPDELEPRVSGIDLDRPLGSTTAALAELESVYLDDAVYFHHPGYAAHLNCPVLIPALLGDLIASCVNTSVDTWDQSVGATLIERKLIGWTAERIGFDARADGVFTSGGSQSNLQALQIARSAAADPDIGPTADAAGRVRFVVSDAGHFSVHKAASVLGLGHDAVLEVASDGERRMDPRALETVLAECLASGDVPAAVVATAGTTDFGSIDPLPEIAEVCRGYGVWLHVDAAYGGGLLASGRRRHLLTGIDRADSVTVDFHKTFFQPVASSAVIVRERDTLGHVTYHADYLNPKTSQNLPNQVDKSLQTTRRFDALKLWLTLRITGADVVGTMFDDVIDLAETAWRLMDADDHLEVLVRPQLSALVFRYAPPGTAEDDLDLVNDRVRRTLFDSGEAVVAGTKVGGRSYLKFTLLNPQMTTDDVRRLIGLVRRHGADLCADLCAAPVPVA